MKKFIFSTLEGWQVLTGDEAYETYGRKGYHNLPLFKAEGKSVLQLKGASYEAFIECASEALAQRTLAHWTEQDDDNVVVYETLADAEKSVRDSYEGEPDLEAKLSELHRAVAGALE